MDTTPPSHRSEPILHSKPASRLARMVSDPYHTGDEPDRIPHFTVDFAAAVPSSSPLALTQNRKTPSSATPSKRSTSTRPSISVPLHDLLLLSPSPSPVRRSRTRLSDRLDSAVAEDSVLEPALGSRSGRRCKARTSSIGLLGCASPRNGRRSRRRLEVEVREEREAGGGLGAADEAAKARKKRQSVRSKKEKISSAVAVTSVVPSSNESQFDCSALDGIGQLMTDLIMWRDVAKSSLWFGFGCICFLSSCFTRGLNFSLFSAVSQLGLLFLGVSFFSSAINQSRNNSEKKRDFKLKEDDIVRVARVVLPALNLAISKTGELFSGEPAMTLKVASFLLMGAQYGHLLTIRRLCALGFFASFTVPKLYILYAAQIDQRAVQWREKVMEMWHSCSRKKVVLASAATAFWNFSSLKTRIFAAFFALVILRYCRQYAETQEATYGQEKKDQLQALVVVEEEGSKK